MTFSFLFKTAVVFDLAGHSE